MDDQEMFNLEMEKKDFGSLRGTRSKVEKLLRKKNGPTMEPPRFETHDPVAQMVKDHPGLTREKALEMLEEFGF